MSDRNRDFPWGSWKQKIDFLLPLGFWIAMVDLRASVCTRVCMSNVQSHCSVETSGPSLTLGTVIEIWPEASGGLNFTSNSIQRP